MTCFEEFFSVNTLEVVQRLWASDNPFEAVILFRNMDSTAYESTSMKNLNESKYGFWGVLARKAKAILEDDDTTKQFEAAGRNQPQAVNKSAGSQFYQSNQSPHGHQKTETPPFQKSSDTIASSLNYIGGTIKNAFEEGLTVVENKTADIIHETRKLHVRRKGSGHSAQNQAAEELAQHTFPQIQTDYETQLKASRDVRLLMQWLQRPSFFCVN